MHYWLTDTKLTIIFFFLTKNAPSDEWDSSKYLVQQRGKCKYGYGEYSVYEYRRHLIVAFHYLSDQCLEHFSLYQCHTVAVSDEHQGIARFDVILPKGCSASFVRFRFSITQKKERSSYLQRGFFRHSSVLFPFFNIFEIAKP